MSFKNYLVLSRIRVKDANALSSPITIGVPAVSSFLGAAHKLQRELNKKSFDMVKITGVGIVIHEAQLQTYEGASGTETLVAYGKPLDKTGKRPSSIPDPRINLCISLVCEVEDINSQIDEEEPFLAEVDKIVVNDLKIAGGDIQPPRFQGNICNSFLLSKQIKYYMSVANDPLENKKILRPLIPGYSIIERRDLMISEMEKGQDSISALIDYIAIHHDCDRTEDGIVTWKKKRKAAGWIVPISVGYQGLTTPSEVKNQRQGGYKHEFAENLVTLGEFRMVNSFQSVSDFIWRFESDLNKSLFKCVCNGGN